MSRYGYPDTLISGDEAIAKGCDSKAFLRLSQILQLIPVGKTTIWHKVKKGQFPAPFKLGTKTSVWKASDIYKYMEKMAV